MYRFLNHGDWLSSTMLANGNYAATLTGGELPTAVRWPHPSGLEVHGPTVFQVLNSSVATF